MKKTGKSETGFTALTGGSAASAASTVPAPAEIAKTDERASAGTSARMRDRNGISKPSCEKTKFSRASAGAPLEDRVRQFVQSENALLPSRGVSEIRQRRSRPRDVFV